jgi:hypothetical protein
MAADTPRGGALTGWSAEAVEQGRRWVAAWRAAGPRLEAVRRRELQDADPFEAIARLCGPADYRVEPRAPKPTSGLIEQQRVFARFRRT